MKIVILDGYTLNPGDLSWRKLEELGDVTVYERTKPEEVIERIGDAEAIYTNKTVLSAEILKQVPNVKFIGVLATGYNVVDAAAAKELGIPVTNVPTYGTDAVSQYVFALLLEICHHVGVHSNAVFDGEWTRSKDFCFWHHPLIELAGKTMGIVGAGRIGMRTATIAQGFGMKVVAFDANPRKELETETFKYVDLDGLYEVADVISLHVPLFESTTGMINAGSIARMKDGVIIINTSRGPLINEADLLEGLKKGKVGYAASDVVSTEPIEDSNVLLGAPNMLITPHIAWAPKEARLRLLDVAVDNLAQYIEGKQINVVNG